MLPSFRLIVATFCCGFLFVFAGLRLATSFNSVNQALPVMAAHAAPIRLAALTSRDQQRGAVTVPVTFDMRFAVSAAQPAPATSEVLPTEVLPAADRATPLLMPLVILPPIAQETARETAPAEGTAKTETTIVAALPSQPAPEPTPAPATIDIPLPEPATVDLTFSPAPVKAKEKEKLSVAAIVPAPPPAQPPTAVDIPLPEPAAVDLTFPPASSPAPSPAPAFAPESAPAAAEPEAETGPKSETAPKSEIAPEQKPETDARAGSLYEHDTERITVAALPEQIPPGTVKLPTRHIPLPKPKAPERVAALNPPTVHHAARTAAPKAKPRRRAMAAKHDDFESFFNAFGNGKQR